MLMFYEGKCQLATGFFVSLDFQGLLVLILGEEDFIKLKEQDEK